MTVLGALGVLAFVVGLLGSVMLHEGGHFLTARRFGMKATHFFVGFGPTLWSTRRGETEYGVKAIPAGGFVKIVGMTPLEEVEPGDEERAFYRQPAGRKTVVLAAGSTVHFLLCLLLVAFAVTVFGVQRETSPTLTAINTCVADNPDAKCGAGSVPAPARTAGLQAGDVVTAVDGVDVKGSSDLVTRVKAHAGQVVRLTVLRKGKVLVIPVTPKAVVRPGSTKPVGAIGVSVLANYEYQHFGPVGIARETGSTVKLLVTGTVDTLTKKLGTIGKVYGPNRDPGGFVGVVGVGRISGEIAQAKISVTDKLNSIVLVLAGLNLFVGVFNLLPLLPLDGGHIAVVWFEQLRDRLRRLRGYTGELQRVDMNKLMPVTLAVVVLFIGFTLFLLGADIVNPITIN